VLHAPEKVFGVCLGSFHGSGVVATFKHDFLERDVGRIFRFEATGDQFSRSFSEAFFPGRTRRRAVLGANVFLELCRG
jgi:hypothetical protein